MTYQIKIENKITAIAIFSSLKSLGYSIDLERGKSIEELADLYIKQYPYLAIYPDCKRIGGNYSPMGHTDITLAELFSGLLEVKEVEVKLNSEYTAKINKFGVSVGCQTFSPAVMNEVIKAWNEANK